jgi:ATP phosphoribosyltransferase
MNIDIRTIGILIIIAILFVYFSLRNNYQIEIQKMTEQLELIQRDNDTLYMKLNLITTKYDEVRKNRPVNIKGYTKVKNKIKDIVHVHEISGMQKFEMVMDSIKNTLPNRTGQDLINSLKIKTEL